MRTRRDPRPAGGPAPAGYLPIADYGIIGNLGAVLVALHDPAADLTEIELERPEGYRGSRPVRKHRPPVHLTGYGVG